MLNLNSLALCLFHYALKLNCTETERTVSCLDYLSDRKILKISLPYFLYLFEKYGFSVTSTKVFLKKLADIELSQFN